MKYYARLSFALYFVFLTVMVITWRQGNIDVGSFTGYLKGTEQPIRRATRKRNTNRKYDNVVLENVLRIRKEISVKNVELKLKSDAPYINHLLTGHISYCDDEFVGYKNSFAKLINVEVDPEFGTGHKGGENMSEVMNQSEESEYYDLRKGFFKTPCHKIIKYDFGTESHLNRWIRALAPYIPKEGSPKIQEWTIAVQRYEYVNMYHTMTDWYNTFLMTKVFNLDPKNVTVLWIDGHPSGGLDSVWTSLFGKVMRVGEITKPVIFSNMIWSIVGYDSPLDDHFSEEVPYLKDFRKLFLSSYNIDIDDELDCDKLNILLIWRRDYVAHPRNPQGSVARKIKNEDELLKKINDIFQGHSVRGLQIDKLPMSEQLSIISKTDILIGMHGAGLSHTLFLPRHAGLIEMFPIYHPAENMHFRAMATWRHLYYLSWSNYDTTKELSNYYTIVDVETVGQLAREMEHHICKT